jgi:hypothetical protein
MKKHGGGGEGADLQYSNIQTTLRPISFLFTFLRTLWHAAKVNSFFFKRFRTLCPETPGVGLPPPRENGNESPNAKHGVLVYLDRTPCAAG